MREKPAIKEVLGKGFRMHTLGIVRLMAFMYLVVGSVFLTIQSMLMAFLFLFAGSLLMIVWMITARMLRSVEKFHLSPEELAILDLPSDATQDMIHQRLGERIMGQESHRDGR